MWGWHHHGYGRGFGHRHGWGYGRGYGYGRRFWERYYGYGREEEPVEDEKRFLEIRKRELEEELSYINSRLSEIR